MQVRIRLFARLRELAGSAELHRDVPEGATVANLWDVLAAEFPGMRPHAPSVSSAVNEEFARKTTRLNDGDEVAFLPPVSGG
ncbi:MAG TPA: molybdopterin converting factor subunit 1 [Vicinamibacterales bacterium]|nr:molybdopterin converting factor subunit 1 [Vicinamibacterales bacterium]